MKDLLQRDILLGEPSRLLLTNCVTRNNYKETVKAVTSDLTTRFNDFVKIGKKSSSVNFGITT